MALQIIQAMQRKMIKVYNDDWKRLTYEIINIFPKGIYVKKEVKDKLNQLYNKYGIKESKDNRLI